MSEERRDQAQEDAPRVLSPVRLAVLLLLGAFFLVLGGSRADAAGAGPAPDEGPGLVSSTLEALDAGPVPTGVGTTVDGVVDPVLTGAEPVVHPVVEPVVEPVVTPLRPVVEQVVPPLSGLPVTPVLAPQAAPERAATPVRAATAEAAEATTTALTATAHAPAPASVADAPADPADPASGTPVSGSAASSTGGGTSTPVPYAVLLTAFVAVLLFAGGIAPRRVVAPLAPTFLPPVFPG